MGISFDENFGKWFIDISNDEFVLLMLRLGFVLIVILIFYIGKKVIDKLI